MLYRYIVLYLQIFSQVEKHLGHTYNENEAFSWPSHSSNHEESPR